MTAQRQDGTVNESLTPPKRSPKKVGGLRASDVLAKRPATAPSQVADVLTPPATPVTAPDTPTVQPAASVGSEQATGAATSKFTVKFTADEAADFDGVQLIARRRLARRVDKSDIVKALIRLAADDASLRDQVINELGNRG